MWPPPYKLKTHPRARHVKLRTSHTHGLEITLPAKFNLKHLPDILETHKSWIIKQLSKIPLRCETLPTSLHLCALNETWPIHYIASTCKMTLIERAHEIVLTGDIKDHALCKKHLIVWIKERAQFFLTTHLDILSLATQLPYTSLSIRDQKTRWGSCNDVKAINLNYKLIFLPLALMQHIMIHELCHTKYLHHGKRFWQLVAKFDTYWQQHKKALREADQFIPQWLRL